MALVGNKTSNGSIRPPQDVGGHCGERGQRSTPEATRKLASRAIPLFIGFDFIKNTDGQIIIYRMIHEPARQFTLTIKCPPWPVALARHLQKEGYNQFRAVACVLKP